MDKLGLQYAIDVCKWHYLHTCQRKYRATESHAVDRHNSKAAHHPCIDSSAYVDREPMTHGGLNIIA